MNWIDIKDTSGLPKPEHPKSIYENLGAGFVIRHSQGVFLAKKFISKNRRDGSKDLYFTDNRNIFPTTVRIRDCIAYMPIEP